MKSQVRNTLPTLLHEMHSEDYTTALQPVPAPFQVSGCPKEPSLVTILGRSDGPAAEAWTSIITYWYRITRYYKMILWSQCDSYFVNARTSTLADCHRFMERPGCNFAATASAPVDVITLRYATGGTSSALVELVKPKGCAKRNLLRQLQLIGQICTYSITGA